MRRLCGFLFVLVSLAAQAGVEFRDVTMSDGVRIQTCARFPDPVRFPGKRPAIMVIFGSGLYDSCRKKVGTVTDRLVDEKGVVVFLRQKRGLRHEPSSGEFTKDLGLYAKSDFPHLKADSVAVLDDWLNDPRIDRSRVAVWGGSEGTVIATHLARERPSLREIVLVSAMIEPFRELFPRQMYEILPRELFERFDKNLDGKISRDEVSGDFLRDSGLHGFNAIDFNHDGALDGAEINWELRRVVAESLSKGIDRFFLSELGGTVTHGWVRSAFEVEDLGPQLLKLELPVYLHHGTADENTLVRPVYDLQKTAAGAGRGNLHFTYYNGLQHQLSLEIISATWLESAERLLR